MLTPAIPAGAADTAPAPGTRIRVTHVADPDGEPRLYVGAEGTVIESDARSVRVVWHDPILSDLALLWGKDQCEAVA